jgi:hypothetical protein
MKIEFILPGFLFLLIVLTGLVLRWRERPFNQFLLAIHKLLSLGCLIYIGMVLYRIYSTSFITSSVCLLIVLTGGLFVSSIATGAVISAAKKASHPVLLAHRFFL